MLVRGVENFRRDRAEDELEVQLVKEVGWSAHSMSYAAMRCASSAWAICCDTHAHMHVARFCLGVGPT